MHTNPFYNGDYYEAEDWNGYSHWESAEGAHLYYLDTGYWQFDNRVQDGTQDYYDGGYLKLSNPYDFEFLYNDEVYQEYRFS